MPNIKSLNKEYIVHLIFFIISFAISYFIIKNSNIVIENLENKNKTFANPINDFGLQPNKTPILEELFIWRKISALSITNITFYNNNLYGIGEDNKIYHKLAASNADWVLLISNNTNVEFIKIFNNEIFAIEKRNSPNIERRSLLVKHKLDGSGKWSIVKPNDKRNRQILNFDIANNNIYAIGLDFKVYQKPIYNGSWRVFTPGSVKYISILNDKIYGVGMDNKVYTYPLATAPVQNTPICILRNPDTGEIRCAGENQKCNFKGLAKVTYRRSDNVQSGFAFRTMTAKDGIMCNNATFGDPAPGHHKSCFYKSIPNIEVTCAGRPGFGSWGIGPDGAEQSTRNCNHYSSTGGFSKCPIVFPSSWKNISIGSVSQIIVVDNNIYGLGLRGKIWKLNTSNGNWNPVIKNGNMKEILIVNHLIYGISRDDKAVYVHPLQKR